MKNIILLFFLALGGVPMHSDSDSGPLKEGPNFFRNRNMEIEELNRKNAFGQTVSIGHLVTFHRRHGKIKAKYFASGDVYTAMQSWSMGKDVALICAGAFTSNMQINEPQGLTVDNGIIVNRNLDAVMDGLVIVYATGGIAVSDLDNRKVKVAEIERPLDLRNAQDKTLFLEWAQDMRATVFQTQLLAYDNRLLLNPNRARKRRANRRFLALVRNRMGDLMHMVFDLKEENYLGELARDIFAYLQQIRNLEVIALLNLDTGAKDILFTFDDLGRQLPAPVGRVNLNLASNILVYYYED